MHFARQFGHVSCVAFREGGLFASDIRRICQFNAPGAVWVKTGQRVVIYQPGLAQPATVTVRRGRASCVMSGWFRS